jgi:hypothetical protein
MVVRAEFCSPTKSAIVTAINHKSRQFGTKLLFKRSSGEWSLRRVKPDQWFFLLSICFFCYRFVLLVVVHTRGRSGLRSRRVGSYPHLLSNSIPTLSREGSAPVRLGADFRSAQPCSELPWARARLETPLTILPKSYNSRQTVATESAHSS